MNWRVKGKLKWEYEPLFEKYEDAYCFVLFEPISGIVVCGFAPKNRDQFLK